MHEIIKGKAVNVRIVGPAISETRKYHKTESGRYMYVDTDKANEWRASVMFSDSLFVELKE